MGKKSTRTASRTASSYPARARTWQRWAGSDRRRSAGFTRRSSGRSEYLSARSATFTHSARFSNAACGFAARRRLTGASASGRSATTVTRTRCSTSRWRFGTATCPRAAPATFTFQRSGWLAQSSGASTFCSTFFVYDWRLDRMALDAPVRLRYRSGVAGEHFLTLHKAFLFDCHRNHDAPPAPSLSSGKRSVQKSLITNGGYKHCKDERVVEHEPPRVSARATAVANVVGRRFQCGCTVRFGAVRVRVNLWEGAAEVVAEHAGVHKHELKHYVEHSPKPELKREFWRRRHAFTRSNLRVRRRWRASVTFSTGRALQRFAPAGESVGCRERLTQSAHGALCGRTARRGARKRHLLGGVLAGPRARLDGFSIDLATLDHQCLYSIRSWRASRVPRYASSLATTAPSALVRCAGGSNSTGRTSSVASARASSSADAKSAGSCFACTRSTCLTYYCRPCRRCAGDLNVSLLMRFNLVFIVD